MSRNYIVMCIGILTAAMPFLGFPSLWKTWYYVAAGVYLAVASVVAYKKSLILDVERREVVTEVFVETNGKKV